MSYQTDPSKIPVGDQSDLLRGEKGFTPESNFWNEPFPEDMLTVNGNIARFEKTWNKTHTTLKNRRCAIKIEVEKSDGSTQIIEVGTFLMGTSTQNDAGVTLQIEDLTKKLIETPASTVKSGYQWYRNIPIKILVEELIKKAYPDPRNGEVPREYLIDGIRPKSPTSDPLLSSLGKPPGFSKLYGDLSGEGVCYSLAKHDLGMGELIYLGIENNLYEYDELNQVYFFIGKVLAGNANYSKTFNIKKLWVNPADPDYLYGMAWPLEDLISTELGETPFNWETRFACPAGNEFIIFKSDREEITVLFDSTIHNLTNSSSVHPKLFSGEFHIVPPYLAFKKTTAEEWNIPNTTSDLLWDTTYPLSPTYAHTKAVWFHQNVFRPAAFQNQSANQGGFTGTIGFYAAHLGYGELSTDPMNDSQIRKPIGGSTYWGRQRNLPVPFAQNIGFSCNLIQKYLTPTFINYEDNFWNHERTSHCFGFSRGIDFINLPWSGQWKQEERPRVFIRSMFTYNETFNKWRPTESRTNFIVSSIEEPTYSKYELDEIYDGKLPSVPYKPKDPYFEHLPYAQTGIINFDPGYLAYYGEYFYRVSTAEQFGFDKMPMPYIKYTSGQKGSVEFLPSYGVKGGIFYQAYVKQGFTDGSNKTNARFRLIDSKDITLTYTGTAVTSIAINDMLLKCYVYDIANNTHVELTNMTSANFRRTTGLSKTYPKQITSVTADGNTLAITSMTFPYKNAYPNVGIDECNIHCHLDKVVLTGGAGTTITNHGDFYDSFFTEAKWIENSVGNKRVLLSGYSPYKLLGESSFDWRRPILGNPYRLWTHVMTGSSLVPLTNFNSNQSRFLTPSEESQSFYFVEVENKNEELGGVKLNRLHYNDLFVPALSIVDEIELHTEANAISISDTNSIGTWVKIASDSTFDVQAASNYAMRCVAGSNSRMCGIRYNVNNLAVDLIPLTTYKLVVRGLGIPSSGESETRFLLVLRYVNNVDVSKTITVASGDMTHSYVTKDFVFIAPDDYDDHPTNSLSFEFERTERNVIIGDAFYIEYFSFAQVENINIVDQHTGLGYINDVVYGDTNQLSNLLPITFDPLDGESVFGVSDGYYANPINKITRKNHLWKYDKYLSGIIELAELSDMSVWDALTDLAYSLNFITGFSNDIFFFIPKAVNSTPDLILDLDLDGVLKVEKVQDYKVENIIRAVPHRVRKGAVEWTIITIPNETLANDTGRRQLNVDLRIDQKDDLEKKLFLRVSTRGLVPTAPEETPDLDGLSTLRFAYLVANNVIETKLIRDVLSSDTKVVLPSLFGQDTESQVQAGDIFVIDYTDETTGESQYVSRLITSIDYYTNEIQFNTAIGKGFLAFTPVTIYRGFYTKNDELRNNKWSDTGVTLVNSDTVEAIAGTQKMKIEVLSTNNLSIDNLVQFGSLPGEYIIESIITPTTDLPKAYIIVLPFRGSNYLAGNVTGFNGVPVKAFFYPQYAEMIEVGGSKIWLGFAPGSIGSLWTNSRGYDRIEIICPGLILEADNQAVVTAVDVDSIKKFGKFSKTIDTNKFFQIQLAQYQAREYLKWNSKPRLIFNIDDIIQAKDKGGNSYTIPYFKFINTSTRKLSNIRVVSRKYLARFPGFAVDCYIIDHSMNIKSFIQSLSLRTKDTY